MSRKLKNNKGKKGVHLLAHNSPNTPISEQYRLIRSNIQFSSVDREIKTIVVTSSDPNEGKSTTAANLATVLAQLSKKVILVDVDLRKPTVHYTFNVSNLDGLTSVLKKEISLDLAIVKTHVPYLDILTCGPIPPNPSELLNSKALEIVIEELKAEYDYIVFDTPPVLAVTDSQIMASKADGVVLVVASGKTHKDRAMKTRDLLETARAKIIGVVVNRVKPTKGRYNYQYGEFNS